MKTIGFMLFGAAMLSVSFAQANSNINCSKVAERAERAASLHFELLETFDRAVENKEYGQASEVGEMASEFLSELSEYSNIYQAFCKD